MNWTRKIPDKPGYYFLDDGELEYMVEVIITSYGSRCKECWDPNVIDCADMVICGAQWLGPINSEDIINLWMGFNGGKEKEKS